MKHKNPLNEDGSLGSFSLCMPIAKSYETNIDGENHMYIQGLASGVGVDHHNEMMASTAIDAFKKAIEEGIILPNGVSSLIPLRSGHRHEWDDVLGYVVKAEIDDEYNLWIEAELDDTAAARDLFKKLSSPPRNKKPLQLGLSVGGKIRKASYVHDNITKTNRKVIEDVSLREISVVGSPAYPTAYVEALEKSVNWDEISEQVQESTMKGTDVQVQSEEAETEVVVKAASEESSEQTNNDGATNSESTASENVNKSEEAAADPETQNTNDVTKGDDSLQSQVDALTKSLSALTESVKIISESLSKSTDATPEPVQVEEVVKSTDAKEEDVEKSLEVRITESMTDALKTFKEDILSELQAVKKNVDEISGQPLDKSFSVTAQKVEEEADPIEKARGRIDKGDSIIGGFVKEAYVGNQTR